MPEPLIITGAPGSPYTRKMLAALRYRRLPHIFISDLDASRRLPQPRVKLWPVAYFHEPDGSLAPMTDSTPILRRLEAEHAARRIVPADPALAFLDALVEDFADEWLTKAMFHYRWTYRADIDNAARVLPSWFVSPLDDARLADEGATFAARQISRLGVVGSSAGTADAIESSFCALIDILDRHFAVSPFLWGDRPGAADFGLAGQLTQLALFDPTPAALVRARAPRVLSWTIAMEDLSGWDRSAWAAPERAPTTISDLLAEIGATYAPLLLANAEAIGRGETHFEAGVRGRLWRQSVFPYQLKCLRALQAQYSDLSNAERASLDPLLIGSGCERLFGKEPS